MVSVKIGNEGTLALRYQLDVVVNGDIGDLADVIDVYYVKDAHARTSLPTDMSEMGSPIGTLRQVLEGSADLGVARGNLIAGEADFATIALKMKESAGNDYQGESIGATFDIMLNATQLTHETDGFGSDQYDATAQYPVSPVAYAVCEPGQGGSYEQSDAYKEGKACRPQ